MKPSPNPQARLRRSDDPNTKLDEGEFIPNVGGGTIGLVKLADFGLSKQIWEHNTKTPCGTVGYTAPEIVRDERYSKEVDMWAIGCVLYTLLCGFPPFYDERIDTLTEKVAKGEYTFLSPWWDEISLEAKRCVTKLLTVDPSQRYTIDEFLQDPWINKVRTPMAHPVPVATNNRKHPIQEFNNRYSKKYTNGMYSPAAVALRDAFDISTAVHRMGEEAKLSNPLQLQQFIEEEEEDEAVTGSGRVLETIPHKRHHQQPERARQGFELNLGGASILERRKHKPIMVPS
ncbi:kinase-like protein [Yamadazyma tenuis ATCC 10573]|nr:kinase-like protein [Yamadazyma tenuis ATCC 10573]EGV64887.1 kinase-like protein [Yamadazyma tenuis ATCC 10573]